VIEYIEEDTYKNVLEIRFDDDNTTLSCSFNKWGKCNTVYFFLECIDDIDLLIEMLNDLYEYNNQRKQWQIFRSFLGITKTSSGICFIIFISIYKR
jgi:hypothetical protein